jgi:hypothetical protein
MKKKTILNSIEDKLEGGLTAINDEQNMLYEVGWKKWTPIC